MECCYRRDCVRNMVAASPVIAEYSPVFEPCKDMLDASAVTSMDAPRSVAQDRATAKSRRLELADTSISTVGEDPAMLPA